MIVLAPAEPHAATELDAHCRVHDGLDVAPGLGWRLVAGSGLPRQWRVAVPQELRLLAPEGPRPARLRRLAPPLMLERGTRLRLDAVGGSFFCDGQVHSVDTYRLCVLDGPLAGCCVEADDTILDDHATHIGDGLALVDAAGTPLAAGRTA